MFDGAFAALSALFADDAGAGRDSYLDDPGKGVVPMRYVTKTISVNPDVIQALHDEAIAAGAVCHCRTKAKSVRLAGVSADARRRKFEFDLATMRAEVNK